MTARGLFFNAACDVCRMPPEADDPTADRDVSALAREVVRELDPGTVIDDKLILSRRQAIGLATGSVGVGVLATLGVDTAAAQAAGQVGTTTDPIDVVAYSLQDRSGSNMALENVASGSVQLSSGTATVSTGVSATGSTFYPALGVDDPNADVNLAAKLFFDDSAGVWKITIDEVGTSIGNPTALYDIIRVR